MTRLTFDQVWSQELPALEGKTIFTLVRQSKNRIVGFTEKGMLRQVWDGNTRQWKDPTLVPKRAFKNLWEDLYSGEDRPVKDSKSWRIAAACIVSVQALGVEKTSDSPLTVRRRDC